MAEATSVGPFPLVSNSTPNITRVSASSRTDKTSELPLLCEELASHVEQVDFDLFIRDALGFPTTSYASIKRALNPNPHSKTMWANALKDVLDIPLGQETHIYDPLIRLYDHTCNWLYTSIGLRSTTNLRFNNTSTTPLSHSSARRKPDLVGTSGHVVGPVLSWKDALVCLEVKHQRVDRKRKSGSHNNQTSRKKPKASWTRSKPSSHTLPVSYPCGSHSPESPFEQLMSYCLETITAQPHRRHTIGVLFHDWQLQLDSLRVALAFAALWTCDFKTLGFHHCFADSRGQAVTRLEESIVKVDGRNFVIENELYRVRALLGRGSASLGGAPLPNEPPPGDEPPPGAEPPPQVESASNDETHSNSETPPEDQTSSKNKPPPDVESPLDPNLPLLGQLSSEDPDRVVIKFDCPPKSRKVEADFLRQARNIPNIVRILCSEELEDTLDGLGEELARMLMCFELCQFRIIVLYPVCQPFDTITDLDKLKKSFTKLVIAHHSLYKIHILHCDILISNMMYDPIGREPYLIDADLGKSVQKLATPSSNHRTGTLPFMALDLLLLTPPPHIYRHKLESFFYVLVWICVEDYCQWDLVDSTEAMREKKSAFFMVTGPPLNQFTFMATFAPLKAMWARKLYIMFRLGIAALVVDDEVNIKTYGNFVTYEKFMAVLQDSS